MYITISALLNEKPRSTAQYCGIQTDPIAELLEK